GIPISTTRATPVEHGRVKVLRDPAGVMESRVGDLAVLIDGIGAKDESGCSTDKGAGDICGKALTGERGADDLSAVAEEQATANGRISSASNARAKSDLPAGRDGDGARISSAGV